MGRFAFEALDGTGTTVRGTLDAPSRTQALEHLVSIGQTPLLLEEAASRQLAGDWLPQFGQSAELLAIVRDLATLLKAGVTVERSLQILESLSSRKSRAARVARMLERVRGGESLSEAMRAELPAASAQVANLVAAGELSGHLPQVMERLANSLKRSKILLDRVLSSLTYPAFLVATMAAVLWIVFTAVLPRLVPMFREAHAALPLPTTVLVSLSDFLTAYGYDCALAAGAALVLAGLALRRESVRIVLDRLVLTTPLLLGIPKAYESARFCRNLETLLSGGLPLDRALTAAQAAGVNLWFRKNVDALYAEVTTGTRLRTAFVSAGIFPLLVSEFSAVGEETGQLAAMMREAADILEQDVEVRLDRLSTLVLPVATLVMGLLIAGVMAGIVTGLLAINDLGS